MKKRQDYISWDEYFMGVALLSAKRSKDPSTQVGACIVNEKNKIAGTAVYKAFQRFAFFAATRILVKKIKLFAVKSILSV